MTLGIGWLIGLAVFFSADIPDGFFGDRLVPYAALLAALAATVGLLLSWGELDLSFVGILAVAGYIYIDVSDTNVAAAIALSALAGVFVGAVIGLLRWLTQAPSGLLSLGGGLVASTLYLQVNDLLDDGSPIARETIDGSWVQVVTALVFVALAVLLGALLGRPGQGLGAQSSDGSTEPGPRVIAGFALSGAAAGVVGAVFLGWWSFGPASQHWSVSIAFWLLPVFTAVAVGGVLRGSWFLAPVAAALGAVAATLLNDGGRLHGWEQITAELVLMGLLTGSLVVSYGLHRVLGGNRVTGGTPAAPPSQPVPF